MTTSRSSWLSWILLVEGTDPRIGRQQERASCTGKVQTGFGEFVLDHTPPVNERRPFAVIALIALVLMGLTAFARFRIQATYVTDVWSWGFPLTFYETWGPCPVVGSCRRFEVLPFLVDLAIWVVVSFGLLSLVRRTPNHESDQA